MKKFSELKDRTELSPTPNMNHCRLVAVTESGDELCVRARDLTDGRLDKHVDSSAHLSASDHENLTRLQNLFPDIHPDISLNPMAQGYRPEGALSNMYFAKYFSKAASPDFTIAPGRVYISRVPWGRWNAAAKKWENVESIASDSTLKAINDLNKATTKELIERKFMDNKGLKHTCSTNTVLGDDDYVGKEWVFYWGRCNYITDAYGVKHITAVDGGSYTSAKYIFSEDKNVGAFGPAFWYFCKTESYKYGVDANGNDLWLTDTGKEDGTPLFQLWGISDRPWGDLPVSKREELAKHGINAEDFSIWPECRVYDPVSGEFQDRPYWVHSAYCGGYEVGSDGKAHIVSKRNKHLYNNLSYQYANATYGAAANGVYPVIGGGGSCVNGFGMLFDIVKNATKNSQSIHMGMAQNNNNAVVAAYSTSTPDYIFPISSQGAFEVGCTVRLWQTNANSGQIQSPVTPANQYGRIISIENRTFDDANGVSRVSLCLVFDPESVQPFVVRTTTAEAKAISDIGQYACCYATQGMAMAGETDWVIGKHDGAVTSLTSQRHPYRVQGTEYMPGAFICAVDTVCCLGNGSISVTVGDEVSVPTSSQRVYLVAPPTVKRLSSGNLASFMAAGYVAVGIGTNTDGYIMNVQLAPVWGVAYPLAAGGTGSSTSTGHADNFWTRTTNPSEFLSGGNLNFGADAGSAYLYANSSLGGTHWNVAARD